MTRNAHPYFEDAEKETRVVDGDGSSAEARLYNLLRQQLPEDWSFLWRSRVGTEHEYDFLVMVPGRGIVNMECKGHGYRFVGGRNEFEWHNDKTGKWEPRDPLGQAAKAKKCYIRYLQDALFGPRYQWGIMGACVVFPTDEHTGCQWGGQPIYRKSDCEQGGKGLKQIVIDALGEGERVLLNRGVRNPRLLTETDAARIWDFWTKREEIQEVPVPAKLDLSTYREHMKSFLTLAQDQALQRILDLRCRRLLITGGAGTGKTIIAQAAAAHAEGRVLYVCYNKVLASYVDSTMPMRPDLTVAHFHGLSFELLGHWITCEQAVGESDEEFWDRLDGEFLREVDALPPGKYKNYDLILVDEAQDLSRTQLKILMRFCNSVKGKIVFFSDRGQRLYTNRMTDEDLNKSLRGLEIVKLNINMRNPKSVVEYCNAYAVSPESETPALLDGPNVVERSLRLDEVDRFLSEEVLPRYEPSDVAVISPNSRILAAVGKSTTVSFYGPEGKKIREISKNLASWRANKCAWKSTTHSFKGMESMAVVHIIPKNQHFNEQLYVGGTRATYQLYVIQLEDDV